MSALDGAIEVIDMHLMQMSVTMMISGQYTLDQAHRMMFKNPVVQDTLDYLLKLRASGYKIQISMATADWLKDFQKWKDV